MIPLIVILGPTASGKTALAIKLAKELDGEIVTADSMQVYKGMDIGTAKPDIDEQSGIVHHLIDIVSPNEDFSLSTYVKLAHSTIEDIHKRGKTPILAGGTGLYIDTVINNINLSEDSFDKDLREKLSKMSKDKLYSKLKEIDHDSAAKLHENDIKRVIRALEIYYLTGKTKTNLDNDSQTKGTKYKCVIFGLVMERNILYNRINLRVDEMVKRGLFEEVSKIYKKINKKNATSMQGLGYKEIIYFFDGLATRDEAINLLKRNTRRFAKRQNTWFKRNKDIIWLDAQRSIEEIKNVCIETIKNVFVP